MATATIKATTKRNRRRRARARLAARPGRPAVRTAGLNEKAAKLIRRACNAFNPNITAVADHLRDRVTAEPHRSRGRLLSRIASALVMVMDRGRRRWVMRGSAGDALRAELVAAERWARVKSDKAVV